MVNKNVKMLHAHCCPSFQDVAVALGELDYVLKVVEDESLSTNIDSMPNVDLSTVYALKDCLGKLEGSLIEFEKTIKVSTGTMHSCFLGTSPIVSFN